jgi:hypothetical protein
MKSGLTGQVVTGSSLANEALRIVESGGAPERAKVYATLALAEAVLAVAPNPAIARRAWGANEESASPMTVHRAQCDIQTDNHVGPFEPSRVVGRVICARCGTAVTDR